MKALILAAGFGTRLLPYTRKIPKPLFTLVSKPMLEHIIDRLVHSGCDQILINTHHLHRKIETFIEQINPCVDIRILYEPVILDTGGAIANAEPFLNTDDFFVINADIITDIDLNTVFESHIQSRTMATLVLHDHEAFNCVAVDTDGYIANFKADTNALAFTGIQVLSPEIFNHLPDKNVFSSIEVYQNLCPQKQVKAFIDKNIFWSDIGTKSSYAMTSLLKLAASEFGITEKKIKEIKLEKLAGDGSDRQWHRSTYKNGSFILSDHDICLPESEEIRQLNAFIQIGRHLFSKGIPVPRILNHDTLSGIVILEDLGDMHLETLVKHKNDDRFTLNLYHKVIDLIIDFSSKGRQGFQEDWACQTATYSKELILEKECRYFIEAFIQNYLNRDVSFQEFINEFHYIADHALKNSVTGLMHRDMQSRNIMVQNSRVFFIDFQSARIGPLQYDLASLLIDPYVRLDDPIKNDLLQYTTRALKLTAGAKQDFLDCYQYCCLTRNLQFLGAFAFLSQIKLKKKFEPYIPIAVDSLKKIVTGLDTEKIPKLTKLVQTL